MRGPLAAIAWACFLGSSWTWVIGMLLPALLVRDYGLWGWIVFAVPNVIGAGAMGFVVATPARSRATVKKHREAALRFSEITIAYHVFVVGALYHRLFGNWGIIATAAMLLALFLIVADRRGALTSAITATAISLTAFVITISLFTIHDARIMPAGPELGVTDLLLFAPAALVGFALCPYLDLTFHKARQHTDGRTGRMAFALGFGVVFLLMIVFSLLYSNVANVAFLPPGGVRISGLGAIVLGAHLTLQAGFTIALHLREIAERRGHIGLHRVFMVAIAAGALAWWVISDPFHREYDRYIGEVIYRVFLLFYGLVFPAYVFLCMIPTRRAVAWWPRVAVFVGAALVAAPMAYAGFVVGLSAWIPAALGVLALGRVIVELLPARTEAASQKPVI